MRTLVELEEFTTDVSVPEDGDTRNADSITVGFQALANRCKYLKARNDELAAYIAAQNQICAFTVAGTNLALGEFATLTKLDNPPLSDGFTLTDSNRRIIPPVLDTTKVIYRVTLQATTTLDSAVSDDAPLLKLRSATSADFTLARGRGADLNIAAGVTFVHTIAGILAPGDIWVKFDMEVGTVRTADVSGLLMIQAVPLTLDL